MAILLKSLRSRLVAPTTLYHRVTRQGERTDYPVHVQQVDIVGDRALISHNNNPARWVPLKHLTEYCWKPAPKKASK